MFSRSRGPSIGVRMETILLHLPTGQRTQELHVFSRLSGPSSRAPSSECAARGCMQIAGHVSLSAELYVNVAVTLDMCCYDSVNDCHKSVAVSGILSVCGA